MFQELWESEEGNSFDVFMFYNDIRNMVADRVTLKIKENTKQDPVEVQDMMGGRKKYQKRTLVLSEPITIGVQHTVVESIDLLLYLVIEMRDFDDVGKHHSDDKIQIQHFDKNTAFDITEYDPEMEEQFRQIKLVFGEQHKVYIQNMVDHRKEIREAQAEILLLEKQIEDTKREIKEKENAFSSKQSKSANDFYDLFEDWSGEFL